MRSELHEQHHEPSRIGPAHRGAGSGTRSQRPAQCARGDRPSVCGYSRCSTEACSGGSEDCYPRRQATCARGGFGARRSVVSGGVRPSRREHGGAGKRARGVGARAAPADGAAEAGGTSSQRRAAAPDAVLSENECELLSAVSAIRSRQRSWLGTAKEERCRRARPGSSSSGK